MSDHSDADSAELAFYRAFEHCDLQAMDGVWEASADSSCIHPGGPLLQGAERVMQSWDEIFSQARTPDVRFRTVQRIEAEGLAIHTVEESIRPGGGEGAATLLIATNIYRRGPSGWRMLAHHACLPMMGQRRAPQGPVH